VLSDEEDAMAKLEKKNINPVLAVLANLCCLSFLGYLLVGQTKKAIIFLVIALVEIVLGFVTSPTLILPFVFGILYLALVLMAAIDVHGVATAVEAGEEVDENEYKLEILYKILSIVQKDAVYKS
jgi:TRAP-type C4-dicarboxylate transport system permease small subunit